MSPSLLPVSAIQGTRCPGEQQKPTGSPRAMRESSQVEDVHSWACHIMLLLYSVERKKAFPFKSSAYFCMQTLLVGSCHRSSCLSLDVKGIWKPGLDTDTSALSQMNPSRPGKAYSWMKSRFTSKQQAQEIPEPCRRYFDIDIKEAD